MTHYALEVRDLNGTRLAAFDRLTDCSYRREQNQATAISFGVSADDPFIGELRSFRPVVLYRDGLEKAAGYLLTPDFSSNPYRFQAITNEALLRDIVTPRSWKRWNGMDLADAVRDLLLGFKVEVRNTEADWNTAVEKVDVEIKVLTDGEPPVSRPNGTVALAKETSGVYLGQYKSHGYITLPPIHFGAIERYELLRWAEDVGEAVRIRAQFRTSQDGQVWGDWSAELAAVYPDEDGVALAGNDPWIQPRFHLYTDDVTSEDPNGDPVGYSPLLHGFEIIARVAGPLTDGNIIAAAGVKVEGFTFDRDNGLNVLRTWTEKYGFEFQADASRRLHFAKALGQAVDVVLRSSQNCDIQRLVPNADDVRNVVLCLGAGSGAAQLQTVRRHQESIDFFGERPGRFEDSSCTTMDQLVAKGDEYLEGQAWPKNEFVVKNVPVWDLPEFQCYDAIKVVDPLRRTISDVRILDEQRQWSPDDGESVTLGLNRNLDNVFEHLAKGQIKRPASAGPQPPSPPVVRAFGAPGAIQVAWSGIYDYVVVQHRVAGVTEWNTLEPKLKANRYTHANLEPGSAHEYQVAGYRNNQLSAWAGPVSAEVQGFPAQVDPGSITRDLLAPDVLGFSYSSDIAPAAGAVENLMNDDEQSRASWALPVRITVAMGTPTLFHTLQLHSAASGARFYAEAEVNGQWVNIIGSAAAPLNLVAGWSRNDFSAIVSRQLRVTVLDPVALGNLEFRTLLRGHLIEADDILVQGVLQTYAGGALLKDTPEFAGLQAAGSDGKVLSQFGREPDGAGGFRGIARFYDENGQLAIGASGVERLGPSGLPYEAYAQTGDLSAPDSSVLEGCELVNGKSMILYPNADAWISASEPSVNHGRDPIGRVGINDWILAQFDLSAIPAGVTITSAYLLLRTLDPGTYGVFVVGRLSAQFEEQSVTGDDHPSLLSEGSTGIFPSAPSVYRLNVTTLAQGWYSGTYLNYGLGVRRDSGTGVPVAMREFGTTEDRPRLVVVYTVPGETWETILPGRVRMSRRIRNFPGGVSRQLTVDGLYPINLALYPDGSWGLPIFTLGGELLLGSVTRTGGVLQAPDMTARTGRAEGGYDHDRFWGNRAYEMPNRVDIQKGSFYLVEHNLGTSTPSVEIWVRDIEGAIWRKAEWVDTSAYQWGVTWRCINDNIIRVQAGQEKAFYGAGDSGTAYTADNAQILVRVEKKR